MSNANECPPPPPKKKKRMYNVEPGGYYTLRNYQDLIVLVSPSHTLRFRWRQGPLWRLSCANFVATPKT